MTYDMLKIRMKFMFFLLSLCLILFSHMRIKIEIFNYPEALTFEIFTVNVKPIIIFVYLLLNYGNYEWNKKKIQKNVI